MTAQYGPTVEVQASVGLQYQKSHQEANQSASRFAREVVNRTVSRIEKIGTHEQKNDLGLPQPIADLFSPSGTGRNLPVVPL